MTFERSGRLPGFEGDELTRLKQQIARREYRVDPQVVAQEILFKLRMISIGRRSLLADSPEGSGDPGPQPPGK
jgi:hypothetical protein